VPLVLEFLEKEEKSKRPKEKRKKNIWTTKSLLKK